MNVVQKIGIAGIGPFKKGVILPIEAGVSFLYGKNLLNGGNANAVGKSLLGNAIGDIFYEPEVRHDKPKAGKRIVVFRKGKSEVKVVHQAGKGERVTLFVNGEDKSARTPSQTKKEAIAKWGLSAEEYQTYGFVDASIPHPLVKGGTPARKAFFTSFFGLDQMDAEKRIFVKELAEVKKVKAAYAELESAFASARVDMLSKEQRLKIESQLAKCEQQLVKLKRNQEQYMKGQRIEAFLSVAGSRLKRLDEVTRSSKEVKADIRAANAAAEQQEEYDAYKKALTRYKEQIQHLDMEISFEELEAEFKTYTKALNVVQRLSDVELPEKDFVRVKPPATERAELERKERQLEHALQHSTKFKTGTCETCGQAVKAEKPASIKAKLQAVQDELELWAAHEKGERANKRFKEEYGAAETEIAVRDAAQKVVDRLKDIPEAYEKRRRLVKPEKVERPDQVYDLDALRKELELTVFAEENAELIEELPNYKPVDFDPAQLNDVQERVFKLKARLDLHNSVKTRAQEIRTRLTELKEAMQKQQSLELILEGYSDKAMKKMAIESISKHLMASVNRYAALVFENYSFEFVWGTQIQILVHRPEGVSDVRKLSGAESMLFTLILILSLLVFVPKNKRLSLLVLDEPYASFSDGTAELFTKLLPHITQVIPSVLIITPKSEFRVDGAHEFTMMKQHGGTVLKKGHPDEL